MPEAACTAPPESASAPEFEEFAVATEGRMLLLPVQLDGRTIQFLLDTGAAITVFDASFRSELGSHLRSTTLVTSAGLMAADLYTCPDARLGRWRLEQLGKVACVNLQPIRNASGQPIYGILGMDFLRYFALEVDFDAGRAKLFTFAPQEWDGVGSSVPLNRDNDRTFSVEAVLPTGDREWLAIDTGAHNSTLRSEVFDSLVSAKEIVVGSSYRVATVAGDIRGQSGYVRRIAVGDFAHEQIRIDRDRGSSLGLRYLARYKLRVDFPGRRIFFEKGQRFADLEPIGTSGLSLLQIENRKVVIAIEPEGAAAKAGIVPGDVVTQINGEDAARCDHFRAGQILTSKPGMQVSLRIRRGETEQQLVLTLQSRIR